ncbi:MAG: DUF4410 domain-containing protein [Chthoniobacterales bacterium]
MIKMFLTRTLLVSSAAVLSGCASVTALKTEAEPPNPPEKFPDHVYVRNFSVPEENLRVDREGEKLTTFRREISEKLTETLVTQLNTSFAPTTALQVEGEMPVENAWLITGEIDRMNQGSRALRTVVGFGAGATKVVTTATVYNLATSPPEAIMAIRTIGGSNSPPGTVMNITPLTVLGPVGLAAGSLAVGAGTRALPGLTDDLRRTAREITATLSDYTLEKGWIPESQALEPKPVGSGSIRLSDPERPGYEGAPTIKARTRMRGRP